MKLRYTGEDGNLKIGGRGLKNGEVIKGTEALARRGDFEPVKKAPKKESEKEPQEETE